MIDRIQRFFSKHLAPEAEEDDERRLRLATAALFVEAMRADFESQPEEEEAVRRAIHTVLGIGAEAAQELIALAEAESRDSVCLYTFTQLVDRGFSPEQKAEVVELLWRIALADGELDPHEEHFVRKVAGLLHVGHRDFIDAKRRARKSPTA